MDVDLVCSGMFDEEEEINFQVDDHVNELDSVEGERCGICMDVVIDRGVLDCCQHWFCFACIDNWATITRLCPLCQSEFQLITCVPVYDTIGSKKADEDLIGSDDDWSIEENSNTLSFPSYYIDEDAVVCLDGDACKFRTHPASITEVADLDTSIACDSCDKWYHAFCVGFDLEGTSEDTWLCPRCTSTVNPEPSDMVTLQKANKQCDQVTNDEKCSMDATFSRKLIVSVADDGETALVVSLVEEDQGPEKSTENFLPKIEIHEDVKNLPNESEGSHPNGDTYKIQNLSNRYGLELSSSQKSSGFTSVSSTLSEFKSQSADVVNAKSIGDQSKASPVHGHAICAESNIVDNINCGENKNQGHSRLQVSNHAESSNVLRISPDGFEHNSRTIGVKRDATDFRDDVIFEDDKQGSRKKMKAEGLVDMASEGLSLVVKEDYSEHPTPKLSRRSMKKEQHSDIMDLVKGTSSRTSRGLTRHKHANESLMDKENAAGLRVKKIIKRTSEGKDSSIAVQNLRKEIREAVRNRPTGDIGENLFDPKLLAAFRAAIAKPQPDSIKPSALALKMKKNMMQKGKVRENLTKKIYGDSNGRRKRAWDRDCEVEFWKYRCMRASKPEKIETLKSVLDVLRKNQNGLGAEPASDFKTPNPILSRLYLADTSVFPRKDDIKPLLHLNHPCSSEKSKEQSTLMCETSKPVMGLTGNSASMSNGQPKTGVPFIDTKSKKTGIPDLKCTAGLSKFESNRGAERSPVSFSAGLNINSGKEGSLKSGTKKDVNLTKADKRKLALEVLSRRKFAENKAGANGEDIAILKGNFHLLAQLPVDMRPSLAPSRHNKIPASVRQAQLYRLAEHFLKKLNLPSICRTADTELAVADAVNIEKEVADRSNSKVVYLNLCSQEILHRSDDPNVVKSNGSHAFPPSGPDRQEQGSNNCSTDTEVVDALRNAGLLSDSPPTSPSHQAEASAGRNDLSLDAEISGETNVNSPRNKEEEFDNLLEMDSHLEEDIYGDFEYDLEDEGYIHVSAEKAPKLEPEENLSKMKVLLSTPAIERSNSDVDLEGHGKSGHGVPSGDCSVPDSPAKAFVKDSNMSLEGQCDKMLQACVPDAEGEEISLAECEELYGPDREPIVNKFPEAIQKPHGEIDATASKEKTNDDNKYESHDAAANASDSRNGCKEINNFKDNKPKSEVERQAESGSFVSKKVEAYIKEHIRPLCKSGVITAEQYRWAVSKTTDKVMKYHSNAKNANFLIKEGEKVKKLAEQYLEAAPQKEKPETS